MVTKNTEKVRKIGAAWELVDGLEGDHWQLEALKSNLTPEQVGKALRNIGGHTKTAEAARLVQEVNNNAPYRYSPCDNEEKLQQAVSGFKMLGYPLKRVLEKATEHW